VLSKLKQHWRFDNSGRLRFLSGEMHSGRIIANVTEQTTTEMMGVNLETQLIRSNLYSLHGAAKDAGLQLLTKSGGAQGVERRSKTTDVEVHGGVAR